MSTSRILLALAAALGLAGLAGPVAAAPFSDFDDGTLQGWVVNDEAGIELFNPGTGGNPGGYALLLDTLPGGLRGTALAPPAFLGDLRAYARATWDILLMVQPTSLVQLVLSGPSATYTYVPQGTLVAGVWQSWEAPLDGGDGWTLASGSGSFADVLANVTSLGLTLEIAAIQGPESGLDNFALVPIPEAGTLILLGPGLAALALIGRTARRRS